MSDPTPTYAAAGVDVAAAEKLVSRFAELAKAARRPEVLADVGPFAGLFRLGSYRDPVLAARIDRSAWETPPLFRLIQQRGGIADEEMYRTFNMGIGVVLPVAPDHADAVRAQLPGAFVIGEVVEGRGVIWR